MRSRRGKTKLTAEQAQCNYLLNGNIVDMPCAMQHLDNIDFENLQTEEEKIKDAIKLLTGFGVSAKHAFNNFIGK